MLVLVLAVAAVILLVVGVTSGPFFLTWVALGLCLVGLVGLAWSHLRAGRRDVSVARSAGGTVGPEGAAHDDKPEREDAPTPEATAEQPESVPEPYPTEARKSEPSGEAPKRSDDAAGQPDAPPASSGVVLVVPGGRRFHREDCRLASQRDHEIIALHEARDEGFTPCTTCAPDRAASLTSRKDQSSAAF